jgi:hypothetical protein
LFNPAPGSRVPDPVTIQEAVVSTTATSIPVTRTTTPRLSEQLRDSAAFGAVFSDHVLVADYADGKWGEPVIVPYGPMHLPPAPGVAHYGQGIFEGFKDFPRPDGARRSSGPTPTMPACQTFVPAHGHARDSRPPSSTARQRWSGSIGSGFRPSPEAPSTSAP